MSLAGTGSLHDRQEDALARNERGIFIRSVEVHDRASHDLALHKKSGQKSDAAVNKDFLVSF